MRVSIRALIVSALGTGRTQTPSHTPAQVQLLASAIRNPTENAKLLPSKHTLSEAGFQGEARLEVIRSVRRGFSLESSLKRGQRHSRAGGKGEQGC